MSFFCDDHKIRNSSIRGNANPPEDPGFELRIHGRILDLRTGGSYRIASPDLAGGIALSSVAARLLPGQFSLFQCYPNPFNPSTVISYSLPEQAHTLLTVQNILGQVVKIVVDKVEQAGTRSVSFDAGSLPSGVYFYRLRSGNFMDVKKMLLMR